MLGDKKRDKEREKEKEKEKKKEKKSSKHDKDKSGKDSKVAASLSSLKNSMYLLIHIQLNHNIHTVCIHHSIHA